MSELIQEIGKGTDEFIEKLHTYFAGKIVRKDLTKKIKEGANVPVYVPCHRVVNRLGKLAPNYVFGSSDIQRGLLVSEGRGIRVTIPCIILINLWDSVNGFVKCRHKPQN